MIGCPVTLAWDASRDTNVIGYALYYGLENAAATNRVDVGPALSATLTNLYAGTNYFFLVVAYNAAGIESLPTGLIYSTPAISGLRIAKLSDGSTVLRFRSAVGSPCRVEYSSLQDGQWLTMARTNADAAGYVVVTDPSPGLPASRFYRGVRIETDVRPVAKTLSK
jgi:hypothetical protein